MWHNQIKPKLYYFGTKTSLLFKLVYKIGTQQLKLFTNQLKGFRHKLFRLLKSVLVTVFILTGLLGVIIIGCNLWVEFQTDNRLYSDIETIPEKNVALLLGTVKYLRNGRINRYFQHRIEAVVKLYHAGKIKHIIASGANDTQFYNEPKDMKQALIAQGIPKQAITLDYAGFRTLDSVVRCKEIFSQEDIIIVSQAFHNQRALFISDFYDIKAIGFNAQDIPFREDRKTKIRECLARVKAVLDLYILRTQPKFLGKKVDIVWQ